MKWVILSGKGGAGKTMVASGFASLCDENWCKMDADVDAANLALLFPESNRIHQRAYIGREKAFIDQERCNQCEICKKVCPEEAIRYRSGRLVIEPIFCEGCGLCSLYCDQAAISMVPMQVGQIYDDQTDRGPLVHARLFPGEAGSGKLVHHLRRIAEPKAMNLLIDGPPGTGCPVLASMNGCTLAIVVMEPSLSGMADGFRTIELAKSMKVPTCIIINKWNLNKEVERKIVRKAEVEGVSVLGIIPFDPQVIEALRQAKPITEMKNSPANRALRAIWERLLTLYT